MSTGKTVSRVGLVAALARELRRQGFRRLDLRQLGALAMAAGLVARELDAPHAPGLPGVGLKAWPASEDGSAPARLRAAAAAALDAAEDL